MQNQQSDMQNKKKKKSENAKLEHPGRIFLSKKTGFASDKHLN